MKSYLLQQRMLGTAFLLLWERERERKIFFPLSRNLQAVGCVRTTICINTLNMCVWCYMLHFQLLETQEKSWACVSWHCCESHWPLETFHKLGTQRSRHAGWMRSTFGFWDSHHFGCVSHASSLRRMLNMRVAECKVGMGGGVQCC